MERLLQTEYNTFLQGIIQMVEFESNEGQGSHATAEALQYGRRLSDKILIAFHHACDARDISTAEDLLGTLDRLNARPMVVESYDRRKIVETLADANYRLWDIKHQQMWAAEIDVRAGLLLV